MTFAFDHDHDHDHGFAPSLRPWADARADAAESKRPVFPTGSRCRWHDETCPEDANPEWDGLCAFHFDATERRQHYDAQAAFDQRTGFNPLAFRTLPETPDELDCVPEGDAVILRQAEEA